MSLDAKAMNRNISRNAGFEETLIGKTNLASGCLAIISRSYPKLSYS